MPGGSVPKNLQSLVLAGGNLDAALEKRLLEDVPVGGGRPDEEDIQCVRKARDKTRETGHPGIWTCGPKPQFSLFGFSARLHAGAAYGVILVVSMRVVCFILLAIPAVAGEYAVLSNGFRMHAESHETQGAVVRLHASSGTVEIPLRSVVRFEAEEFVPPPAPVAAPVQAAAAPTPASSKTPQQLIEEAANEAGLPPAIVHSVAKAESGYRQEAISPKGAVGVMQLMPATAAALHADPHNTAQNVQAGTTYLRELLVKYNGDVAKALAAYNAGPGAVDKYNGVPPYPETRSYVNRVIGNYKKLGGE